MKDDRLLEMQIFRAVVDSNGFTAAARVLGVSQSFVSQTLHRLERRLGVLLLQRSTRAHRLTDEGQRFLELTRSILDQLQQGEQSIASGHQEVSGVLRVSAPLAFGLDQVVPRVSTYMNRFPGVELRLSLSDVPVNLIEENIDVAIRMGALQDSSLVSYKLCNLKRLVIASPAYVTAHGAPTMPEDLAHHNCLLWHGSQSHLNQWPFRIGSSRQEIEVRGSFGSDNGMTLFDLCLRGMGIMRCAEHLALPGIREGLLVALLTEHQWEDDTAIHALVVRERRSVPRVRTFVQYLVEEFCEADWVQQRPSSLDKTYRRSR